MSVWLVRAGRNGEHENFAIENKQAVIGWDELPDLAQVDSRDKLSDLMQQGYPDKGKGAIANFVGQVWAFRMCIERADLIVLPLKTRSMIAIGKCVGEYKYQPANPVGARHTCPVEWLREDIPRDAFGQDLLYSFGAFMTVCQVKRNNAEQRIRAVFEGREDPVGSGPGETEDVSNEISPVLDLEQYAADQIRQFISRKFKAHELAQLVSQILHAEGYQLEVSPPGPDGGVDIVAGRGPMGFDAPRLCVQVKSTTSPADVKVFRELRGVMEDRGADQGLLVSWGGFTREAIKEARRQFFRLRLWDASTLVGKVLTNYEKLNEELRAELPLKRIWALVLEEE